MNIPPRVIWRLSLGRNEDSDLISPKCPQERERVLASGKQPSGWPRCSKWVTSFERGMEKWRVPQPIWQRLAQRSPFVSMRIKAAITQNYPSVLYRYLLQQSFFFFSACLYCHHFMKVCECGLWLNVLENSQGEEPFISQASAITEACSHRHNHLLELLEIGSPKRYHSIQGNLCRCHSSKNIFLCLCWTPGGKTSAL